MGVRIDGSNDVVSAADGSLTVDGLSLSVTGIITASGGFKVGSAYTAYSNGNVETTGIITTSGGLNVTGGLVGINSTSPATALDIQSTKNGDGLTITKAGTRSAFLGHNGSGNEGLLTLKEGGTTRIQLYAETGQDSYINSGNVGVGTIAPTGNFEVNGNDGVNISNANRTGSNGAQWRFIPHNGGAGQSPTNLRLYEGVTATEVINITKTGLIGVNTMAPGTLLELKGESSKEADVTFNRQPVQGTNDGVIGQLLFENATDSVAQISVKRESAADDAYIQVATQATGGGMTERLRINSNGKTGINISNPGSYNSSGNELVLGNTSSNAGMTIVSNSSNNGHIFFADGTASGAQNRGIIKYEHGNDAMAFNTAESERLRLTSSGDLLVGHGSVISNMKFGGSGDFGSHAEIIGANKGFANGLAILNYDASATIPALLKLATSRSDTNGTNTAVGDNDNCGGIQFMGNDGTRFIDVARIDGVTDGAPGANDMPGRLMFLTTADGGSVVTERMRITSTGKIRIKCADFDADPSASNAGLQLFDTSGGSITSASGVTSGSSHAVFLNPNGVVGQIQTSGSATTYSTSSDYRLKENVADLTGAIARVKQLAPKRFNFIADDTTVVDGFLAHEAQTVVPEAVTGTHNEVDGDGNPVIQGIDQAKLVPLLTAALKEAITKIETLETKVAALEGG